MVWKLNYTWETITDNGFFPTTCKHEAWEPSLKDKEKRPNTNRAFLKLEPTNLKTLCPRLMPRLFRIMSQRITDRTLANRAMALMLSGFLLFGALSVFAEKNIPQVESITGEKAKRMILDGIVIESFSKEVQYGVKYFYLVLYFGRTWLCEQATYRTTCNLQK